MNIDKEDGVNKNLEEAVETYVARRSLKSLDSGSKWKLFIDYLSLKFSNREIADKYNISQDAVSDLISKLYKRFQLAKETNTLVSTRNNPDLFHVLKTKYVDSDYINTSFISLLSEPTSLVLSDNEIIFCEVHLEYGDDLKAIEDSKLNIGLGNESKRKGIYSTYKEACLLRAFYLKKKPNIANYINEEKRKRVGKLENGKEYLQEHLISLIEQLRNSGDRKNLTSMLKATEQLGRTIGAFDDKMTVSNFDGDKVLDMILDQAKKINSEEDDSVYIEH